MVIKLLIKLSGQAWEKFWKEFGEKKNMIKIYYMETFLLNTRHAGTQL